jgi:hypothetical protein
MSAPTLVQYNDGVESPQEISFLSDVTAGNFLVCAFSTNTDFFGAVAPVDSLGNTWLRLPLFSGFPTPLTFVYCPITYGGACTVSSLGGNLVAIAEFSPSTIVDFTQIAAGSAASAEIAGAANQLLVGYATGEASGSITGAGAGFTFEQVNASSRMAMEYQALSGSGNVGSNFTGTGADITTGALILATPTTPAAETPYFIQASPLASTTTSFKTAVTAGDFLIVYCRIAASSVPSLTVSGGSNNWQLLESSISGTYAVYVWCVENCQGGSYSITIGGNTGGGTPLLFALEFSPSAVAAQSPVATGALASANIASASIATAAAQLVVGYGDLIGADQIINAALGGFQGITPSNGNNESLIFEVQPSTSSSNFASNFSVGNPLNFPYSGTYFTGVLSLYTAYVISGNAGVAGAVVSYSGTASGSVIAGSGGAYSIPGLAPGSYTITPSLSGYTFSPTSHSETITSANITGVNFTPTQTVVPTSRFTFIERQSTTPGATTYDVMDGSSTNTLGRTIAGSGRKVGELFWDNVVAQAWSFNLQDNQPYIAAGSSDALDIEYFATSLAAPAGVTTVQPSNTPSTRFAFAAVTKRSGQTALQYLVSDGPTQSFGSIAQIIWDGVFDRWAFLQTNAASEIASPNDVACITTFASDLALINPNQISL